MASALTFSTSGFKTKKSTLKQRNAIKKICESHKSLKPPENILSMSECSNWLSKVIPTLDTYSNNSAANEYSEDYYDDSYGQLSRDLMRGFV